MNKKTTRFGRSGATVTCLEELKKINKRGAYRGLRKQGRMKKGNPEASMNFITS